MTQKIGLLFILFSFHSFSAEIDQTMWYEHGIEPGQTIAKYSGVFVGSMKISPTAVSANGIEYYTYTKCIYINGIPKQLLKVADSTGKSYVVNRYENVCDFHDNAAIRVGTDGYIRLYKSARGGWRPSHTFVSKRKYDISEWQLAEVGDRAYPQAWSMGLIYTRYNGAIRELYVKANNCEKKLVSGGHYAVSHYDGNFIHIAYNYHVDNDLQRRKNIYYMRSADGCHWQNAKGEALNLPVIADSPRTLIKDTDTAYAYLKDIDVINGKVHIAYVNTLGNDPSGLYPRRLKVLTLDGKQTDIAEVCHNYNSGSFVDGNIVFPMCGNELGRAGGPIYTYSLDGIKIGEPIIGRGAPNFVRKIIGSTGFIYGDTASSVIDYNDAVLIRN